MKKMGFVKSEKENERRIALLPDDMDDLKDFADYLVFETDMGRSLELMIKNIRQTAHIQRQGRDSKNL